MTSWPSVSGRETIMLRGDGPVVIERAATALRAGHVIAIPTDTVYGLAAALDQPAALDQLYSLKRRARSKAIPILLGSLADLRQVAAHLSPTAISLAHHFWPGALTLVVAANRSLPDRLAGVAQDGTTTVAVRVPDHELARAIISAAGGAVAVTSANLSGEPPAFNADGVVASFPASGLIIIDGGDAIRNDPSTVVLALTSQVTILREGAILAEAIDAALHDPRPLARGCQ